MKKIFIPFKAINIYYKYIFLISTLFFVKTSVVFGQDTTVQNRVDSREERIDWHREARFGAMVHFTPDGIGKMNYYEGRTSRATYMIQRSSKRLRIVRRGAGGH